jgi:hypothetical protein
MQSESLEAIRFRLEEKIARERAEVEYVIGIIEDDELNLSAAFLTEDKEYEDEGQMLFDRTLSAIKWVESQYSNMPVLRPKYEFPDYTGNENHLVKAGWAVMTRLTTKPNMHGHFAYQLIPSRKGVEITDGLRAIQGKKSLGEVREARRQHLENNVFSQ